jgi:hypothetical protein
MLRIFRSPVWPGTTLLFAALLLMLCVQAPRANAAIQEEHFCWGKSVAPFGPESVCYEFGTAHHNIRGLYASGVQHSICLKSFAQTSSEKRCTEGPGQGVYIPLHGSEESLDLGVISTNGAATSTTVHGVIYWDQSPPSPPPPPAWYNENLGGNTPSDPAIASWGPGRADVFARGSNDVLCHKSYDPVYGWSAWEQIPVGPTITSGPSAVSWGYGRIDVVARIADGSVQHWSWQNGAWSTENLGGNILGDPSISSRSSEEVDVFARGTDNSLDIKTWNPTNKWSLWERVPVGPLISSGPGSVSWGPSRIDVVADVNGGSVQHWSWDSGVWNTENLGGNVLGDPAISARSVGVVDVFGRGTNSVLYHKGYDPTSKWSAWEAVPGGPLISSGVGAVSWSSERIDVVADVNGGSVQHWSWVQHP